MAAAVVTFWLLRSAGRSLVVSQEVGRPDAIVMLASHEWERLPATAALARRFPHSTVLLTIPFAVTKSNCYLCAERRAWLVREGIPADRVVELDTNSIANTYGEALATRAFATTHGVRALVVVTSPYHTRRALHVFEHVLGDMGVEVGVIPASAYSAAEPERWWRHPYDRWYVAYEWAAQLEYRIKYRVPVSGS